MLYSILADPEAVRQMMLIDLGGGSSSNTNWYTIGSMRQKKKKERCACMHGRTKRAHRTGNGRVRCSSSMAMLRFGLWVPQSRVWGRALLSCVRDLMLLAVGKTFKERGKKNRDGG